MRSSDNMACGDDEVTVADFEQGASTEQVERWPVRDDDRDDRIPSVFRNVSPNPAVDIHL